MRLIICDRCGKKLTEDDIRHTMTVARKSENNLIIMHCDRIRLISKGELKADHEIDLCDQCKESFVKWFGKIGLYETR